MEQDNAMLPKKKARKNPSHSASEAEASDEAEKLIRWLDRGKLESLLLRSISEGVSISLSDLRAAAPDQAKVVPAAAVKSGASRVGTGPFDGVTDDVLATILHFVPLRDRIGCVSAVCKSWRELKSFPGLFTDLSAKLYEKDDLASAKEVVSLLGWAPNLLDVVALRISTSKSCNPNACKNALKRLGDTKKKEKKDLSLRKLVLFGPKITSAVFKSILSNDLSSKLTSLHLDSVKASKVDDGGFVDLLKECPSLEELRVPQEVIERCSLGSHLQALISARSGAPLLLRVLDLSGGHHWCRDIDWSHVRKIGTMAPELEVLKIDTILGTPTAPYMPDGRIPPALYPPLDEFLVHPMIALPRLRKFEVAQIITSFGSFEYATTAATTPYVGKVLSWLFAGMPVVEDFAFGHGTMYLSRKEEKVHRLPALPGIPSHVEFPRSIKRLELRYMMIGAHNFEMQNLPNLECAKLVMCGPSMLAAMQELGKAHGTLTVGVMKSTSTWGRGPKFGDVVQACVSRVIPKGFEGVQ